MVSENKFERALPYIKKWFFSGLLFIPTWIVIEQFWMALTANIFFAVNYPYPFFVWPLLWPLDNLTLIIHESGHTIFSFFGWRFLAVLGGTLMQMLIPFAVFATAWYKKQRFTAQFGLFWLGFSWMDSAAYCADAMYRNLPLIGGLPKTAHDFRNILISTNLLDHYMTIAWLMFIVGLLLLVLGLAWPVFERKDYDYVDLESELKKSGLR